MGEVDYMEGGTTALRDNSEVDPSEETQADSAAQPEVDFTAEGGIHAPTGLRAKVEETQKKVLQILGDLHGALDDYLSAVENATSSPTGEEPKKKNGK